MTTPPPPNPVVENGHLECPNKGVRKLSGLSAKPGATKVRLTVASSPVVPVSAAGGPGAYDGCTYSDNTGASACSSTLVQSTGATKLTVGGKPVLLSNDSVQAVNLKPSGSGTATVTAGQSKLRAT